MKASNYLDAAINKLKLHSDNELARMMNWSKSQVNNYRHNRNPMDNRQALQIAEAIDVPVWQVIADMEIQRAEKMENEPLKRKWSKLSKMQKEAGRATAKLLFLLPFPAFVGLNCILC